MAAISIAKMTAFNAGKAITATALAAADEHTIDVSNTKTNNFQVLIENTSTNPGTVTFVNGGFYSEDGQGDLAVAVAASSDVVVALESARFKDSAGKINLTVAGAGFTGQAFASELP